MTRGIEVQMGVTIDSDCDVSCEVLRDQLQLVFGRFDTELRVYLDWPTLDRIEAVTRAARARAQMTPEGEAIQFMVSADAHSRKEHRPNLPHDGEQELLVSDVDDQAGRQPPL